MSELVFVDIETFGLDPYRHSLFEVAIIKAGIGRVFWIDPTPEELGRADAMALKVNHFYSRLNYIDNPKPGGERLGAEFKRVAWADRFEWAKYFCRLTEGCVLAGNNVKFDQQFLESWLRKHGAAPSWDYHVLDVPTFAAGVMYERNGHTADPHTVPDFPFKSSKVSKWFNVDEPQGADAHTALADAQWAKDVYEAVCKSRVAV